MKAVAQLEERLGVKLLARTTRGLSATSEGQEFFRDARRSIDESNEADLAARTAGAGLTGRLRVSAAVTFARLHLIPHLAQFMDHHPDLDLELLLDDRNVDLLEGGIDLALRMGHLADLDDDGTASRREPTVRGRHTRILRAERRTDHAGCAVEP